MTFLTTPKFYKIIATIIVVFPPFQKHYYYFSQQSISSFYIKTNLRNHTKINKIQIYLFTFSKIMLI